MIDSASCQWPAIFSWLQQTGNVSTHEMYRIFNCSVGMLIVLPAEEVSDTLQLLNQLGEKAWQIGEIVKINAEHPQVTIS